MKKLTLAILCLLAATVAQAGTPLRANYNIDAGKININWAYGMVNGTTYYAQSHYDDAYTAALVFQATRPVVSSLFTPTNLELTLSSCALNGFGSLDNFVDAQTQAGIMPYLDELKVRIMTLTDSAQNSKKNKAQSCYDYMSDKAKSLP